MSLPLGEQVHKGVQLLQLCMHARIFSLSHAAAVLL